MPRVRGLTRYGAAYYYALHDSVLAALPEVSRHDEPQIAPQEYDCGCVTVLRVTDRTVDAFEMRLAIACGRIDCEIEAAHQNVDQAIDI